MEAHVHRLGAGELVPRRLAGRAARPARREGARERAGALRMLGLVDGPGGAVVPAARAELVVLERLLEQDRAVAGDVIAGHGAAAARARCAPAAGAPRAAAAAA